MMLTLCTVYILSHFLVGVSSQIDSDLKVKLPSGEIRGKFENGFTMFKGIPYAKPPNGALRLREPEKPDIWSTILDATEFGPKCPQLDLQGNVIGKEECLSINVFVLKGKLPNEKLPVMVFIHGDDFQSGSSDMYLPGRFANPVVLVTFNYRLGILGFLSTGDNACPGNMGLKDQRLALQWVRDNIQYFGGDSNSITLFGQGAGAASVFLHILSPQSKGLFHRAITQSGSPLCNWAFEEKPYKYAAKVADQLRCSRKSTKVIADCIRRKDLREVLQAQKYDATFAGYPLHTLPVVERNGFLPDTPENLLRAGNFAKIPLMSGINKDDGAIFYSAIKSKQEQLQNDANFLLKELIPLFLSTATNIRGNEEAVSHAIHFHYFSGIDPKDVTQVLQPFINMTTDALFVSCQHKTLQLYSATGAPVYMYTFEYKGPSSMLDMKLGEKIDYNGVSHGDELFYLFDINGYQPENQGMDSTAFQMKGQMPFWWRHFAINGNSSVDAWKPYKPEDKTYFKINQSIIIESSYRQKEIDFWLDFLPKLSQLPSDKDVRIGGFGWAMLSIAIILLVAVVVLSIQLIRRSKKQYFNTKTDDK